MPTIYDLKPKFQAMLRPVTRILHQFGITANSITIAAVIASVLYGGWMFLDSTRHFSFLLLPLFMFFRMALNAIDGMLAREYVQQSKLGVILNEVGDVVSDAALYAAFGFLPGVHTGMVATIVFLSVFTEFVGVLGQVVGGGRRYDGPLGKSDRAFLFGVLGLMVGFDLPILAYLDYGFSIVIILLVWTVVNRVRQALRYA